MDNKELVQKNNRLVQENNRLVQENSRLSQENQKIEKALFHFHKKYENQISQLRAKIDWLSDDKVTVQEQLVPRIQRLEEQLEQRLEDAIKILEEKKQ